VASDAAIAAVPTITRTIHQRELPPFAVGGPPVSGTAPGLGAGDEGVGVAVRDGVAVGAGVGVGVG
jgi:hypothetical protein